MRRYFIDSNVFLRFFAKDDRRQYERALQLIKKSEDREIELVTGPPVFFEVAWVLRSTYKISTESIAQLLDGICGIEGLEIIDRDIVESAIKISGETGVAFSDAYISVSSADIGADAVATFNAKDFERAGANVFVP